MLKIKTGKLAALFVVAGLLPAMACSDIENGYALYAHDGDKSETPLLSFSVISDTHCDSDISSNSNTNFSTALHDLHKANPNAAALIIAGDITQHARDDEYHSFNRILGSVPHPPVYAIMGNHDVRWLSGGFTEAYKRYTAKTGMPGAYFDKWIKGYHFIFLATEKDLKDAAHLSDIQLSWLDTKLAENAVANRPVFVFLHQALPGTTGGSYPADKYCNSDFSDGVVQDGALRNILAKYPQSIFITGHTHISSAHPNSVTQVPGMATCVNASSVAFTKASKGFGHSRESEGMVVDVYSDKVIFKSRNFSRNLWINRWTVDYSSSLGIPVSMDKKTYASYLDSRKVKGENKEKIDVLKKTIGGNPKNIIALKKVAYYFMENRDYINADDYFKKYLAINPTDDDFFNFGKSFSDHGQHGLSVNYFVNGYKSSNNMAYLKWLSAAYQKIGDTGKADASLRILNKYAEIPKTKWKVVYADSEETRAKNNRAVNTIDGKDGTYWHTEWKSQIPSFPHEIIIDLGDVYTINGFSYLPRQDGNYNGDIGDYELYLSIDRKWNKPFKKGKFQKSKIEKFLAFDTPINCRYIKLRALSEVNGKKYASAAEITVYSGK